MLKDELLTKKTDIENTELGVFINDGHFGAFSINREISDKIFSKLLEGNFDIYGNIENDHLLKYQKTETAESYLVNKMIEDKDLISKIINEGKFVSNLLDEKVYKYEDKFFSVVEAVDEKYFSDWQEWFSKIDEIYEKYREEKKVEKFSDEDETLYCMFLSDESLHNGLKEPQSEDYKSHNFVCELNLTKENSHYFENDTFIIRPYYWGLSDEISEKPNFVHKPSGFKLKCYKYFMRGATCNKEISSAEFKNIVQDCINSIS